VFRADRSPLCQLVFMGMPIEQIDVAVVTQCGLCRAQLKPTHPRADFCRML
jgi:hypothetical protein